MARNIKNNRELLSHQELHDVYEQAIHTVYSREQLSAVGGTMGGVSGTLGSTRGDRSGAYKGGLIPKSEDTDYTLTDKMIDYDDFI